MVQAALLSNRPDPLDLDALIEAFVAAGAKVGRRFDRLDGISLFSSDLQAENFWQNPAWAVERVD